MGIVLGLRTTPEKELPIMMTVRGDGGQSGCSAPVEWLLLMRISVTFYVLYCIAKGFTPCSGRDKRICGETFFFCWSLVYAFPLLSLGWGTGGLRQMGHMEMVCRVCFFSLLRWGWQSKHENQQSSKFYGYFKWRACKRVVLNLMYCCVQKHG